MKISKLNLLYNADAYFEAQEKYPDGINKAIVQEGKEGFEAICYALALMGREWVAYQRYIGNNVPDAPAEDEIRKMIMPYQINKAQEKIIDAMVKGLPRNGVDADTEIDEVLAEMEKKVDGD